MRRVRAMDTHSPARLLRHGGADDLPPARVGRDTLVGRPRVSPHRRATVGTRRHHHPRGACEGLAWSKSLIPGRRRSPRRGPDRSRHRAGTRHPRDVCAPYRARSCGVHRSLGTRACDRRRAPPTTVHTRLRWQVDNHCSMGVPGPTAIRMLLNDHLGDTDSGWNCVWPGFSPTPVCPNRSVR